MIIKRKELYDEIIKYCNKEYAIGMHEVSYSRIKDFEENLSLKDAIDNIIYQGLKIRNGRTINGTVKFFGRIDKNSDEKKLRTGLENYIYSGNEDIIIVACPAVIRNEDKQIYIGTPNLKSKYIKSMGYMGEQKTSLCEYIIPHEGRVDSQFILGVIHLLENGMCDLKLNRNHMCFNDDMVSSDVFKRAETYTSIMLNNDLLQNVGAEAIINYADEKFNEEINKEKKEFSEELYAIAETLTQMISDKRENIFENKKTI